MEKQVKKMNKSVLAKKIKKWGVELGFQQIGITKTELHQDEAYLIDWLSKGRHGEMSYMKSHGTKRSRPSDLLPGTISIICARMDYLPKAFLLDTCNLILTRNLRVILLPLEFVALI